MIKRITHTNTTTAASAKNLGILFREYREAKGWTQKRVAKALGQHTSQSVSNWERGIYITSPQTAKRICRALGIPTTAVKRELLAAYKRELDQTLN